jgi:hypothetical protein
LRTQGLIGARLDRVSPSTPAVERNRSTRTCRADYRSHRN